MVRYLRLLAGSLFLFLLAVPVLVVCSALNTGSHILLGFAYRLVMVAYAIRGKALPSYLKEGRPSSQAMANYMSQFGIVVGTVTWLVAVFTWNTGLMLSSVAIVGTACLIATLGRLMK